MSRIGIRESLVAPGLVTPPPVAGTLGQELLVALRIAGHAGEQLGQAGRQIGSERIREAREAKEILEGMAVRDARERLPSLVAAVEKGELLAGAGNIQERVVAYLDSITADADAPYKDKYREQAAPILIATVERRNAAFLERELANQNALLADNLKTAQTFGQASQIVAAARRANPKAGEIELLSEIVRPAMDDAAARGDEQRLKVFASLLGEHLPAEKRIAKSRLAEAKSANQQRDLKAFRDDVAGMYIEGAAFKSIENRIRSYKDKVPNTAVDDALRELEIRSNASTSEAAGAALKAEDELQRARVLDEARARVRAGVGSTIGDAAWTLSDGTERSITAEKIEEAAVNAEMAEAADNADTPDAGFAAQVQILSRNNAVYKPWRRILEGGYTALVNDLGSDRAPEAMPPSLMLAYDLDRRLEAVNPRLRERLHANPQSRRLYDLIGLAEKYAAPGDPNRAALIAFKAAARGALEDSFAAGVGIADTLDATKAERWFGPDWGSIENVPELHHHVTRLARLYVGALGINQDAAIEEAAQRVKAQHTIINGWAIYTGGQSIPPDLPLIAEAVAEDYATRHGDAEGVDANDLALIPGETQGTYILWNKRHDNVVESWRSDGFFTNVDLHRIREGKDDDARIKKLHETVRRAAAKRAGRDRETQEFVNRLFPELQGDMGFQGP